MPHLPAWLNALINGVVLGFFLVFDIWVARVWRRDPALRERWRLFWSQGRAA